MELKMTHYDTISPALLASRHLQRRFNFPEPTARLLAHLAGFQSECDTDDSWQSLGEIVIGIERGLKKGRAA
jgi:hypothetical protein